MHIVRATDAPHYTAPGHERMEMRRIQGLEAGPSDSVWIGVSYILPGGQTTSSASPTEKFYVMLEGELLLSNGSENVLLQPGDSCRFEAGESRQLRNMSDRVSTILLVMPKTVPEAIQR